MNLNDNSLLCEANLIGENWINVSSVSSFNVTNPATGSIIGNVPNLGFDEANEAIKSAMVAQKSWAKQTAKERSDILSKWYELIVENVDDLAQILTSEQGKPLSESKGEILYGASFIEWFAQEARRIYGDVIPSHAQDKRLVVIKQPIGVVAAVTPWNFPNAMITRKVGPALAAGCAIVLKPASQTPFSAIALALLADRAGLPKGLFSVITGSAQSIGKAMTQSTIVRKLTFTGSTSVGVKLMEQCAPTIKKLALELGGNAPFIVFNDADLDEAVEGAIISKFRNNGQTCVCANRIYVQELVYDEFAEKLTNAISKLKVGNGFDEDTVFGPLIDEAAAEKVQEHVDDAIEKGAQLVIGGKPHSLGKTFYEPTILKNASSNMAVASDETFGPMAALFKFKTEKDVIEFANDTQFGLASYFYTKDLARSWRVGEALEYGMVGINTGLISTAEAPFGGIKSSGIGREGSRYGIEEFTEIKYMCFGGIDEIKN